MAGLSDEEVSQPVGLSDEEVMTPPPAPAVPEIPQAFANRLAQGRALTDPGIIQTVPTMLGLLGSPEGREKLFDAINREFPVFADVAKSKGGNIDRVGIVAEHFINSMAEQAKSFFGSAGQSETSQSDAALNAALLTVGGEALPIVTNGAGQLARIHPTDGFQVVGTMPSDADFKAGAIAVGERARKINEKAGQINQLAQPNQDTVEQNLRDLWETRGIHPAEAVHDAQSDALLRHQLTTPAPDPVDRSGLPHVLGSPVQLGTPRSELAKTGEPHIDTILESEQVKSIIDNPTINRDNAVPYTAGASSKPGDPTINIDRRFPRSFTIDGVTYDPAEPFTVHETVEKSVMELLTKGGMSDEAAYRVAHFEYAEKAEGAWYKANGIDQAKAEAAYAPYMAFIQHVPARDTPPNLYVKPYPHDNPSAAIKEPIAEPKPSKDEIARAKDILGQAEEEGKLRAVGADVTAPMTPLAQQPVSRSGALMASIHNSADKLFDIGRDLQMKFAPMAVGSREAQATAKDFANTLRRNRWEWSRQDDDLVKRFSQEQRKRMWDAADEESVLRQEGKTSEHMGLATLTPEERGAVESFSKSAQITWMQMRDLGMVKGEGLPLWTPRAIVNAANAVEKDGSVAFNRLPQQIGQNLRTTAASLRHRKYLTAEETEAAAKAAFGDEAVIARDIRVLPMSIAKEQDAIAGRKLINAIKEYGNRTGDETVAEGFRPDKSWFTIDHPAFYTWRPKFEGADTKAYLDAVKAKSGVEVPNAKIPLVDRNGDTVFERVPIFVRGDFEGPLRAVLSQRSGAAYSALMSLKGKTMGLIMNSPLIHNAVEWGRALPAMPGKVATFRVYFDGNRAKHDPEIMHEAIDAGLVPIGHRFFNQDISSIMEAPNLKPGRSWTSQILGLVPGLFDPAAGEAVKAAIDKAGDFWHNTLLWDRVGDLQMGLYKNFRDEAVAKGIDQRTATIVAAHFANRFAGALPEEAMSANARKIANMLLFSRSFTLGNLGVMKDVITGLPKDVTSQIGEVDPAATGFAKALARRRAAATIAIDIGLFYVGNAILQSAMNVLLGDNSMSQELHGYVQRFVDELGQVKENPMKLLQPFDMIQGLTPQSQNEPRSQDRAKVGYAKDGTAIYARNPTGKIGEEFTGYLSGPLDMLRRKLGTVARPAYQILNNDAGFGRKIYDPDAKGISAKFWNIIVPIVEHIAGSQLPEGQLQAFHDLVKGEGDAKVNMLQAFGPLGGVTFSKGAPGGPAIGEMFHAREEHDFAVQKALPDIRRQIKNGDLAGAQQAMVALGIPKGLRDWYVRTTLNPSTAYLSKRALDNFYNYASPEERQRFENAR